MCCTLGMLSESQATRLKEAGLTAYNHNLDTSPEFYGEIITTRVYEDRLRTIVSCTEGGNHSLLRRNSRNGRIGRRPHRPATAIIESQSTSGERADQYVRSRGGNSIGKVGASTPSLMVRTIATARILMPASSVRLAAGRQQMSREAVALCFLAGANSIFSAKNF